MNRNITLYEAIGGADTVRRMVEAFYPKVQADPLLGPLFPEDIDPVMEKQYMFLTQFFGGPSLFSDAYGHPMMRARHMPFKITPERAQAWLECMSEAMDEVELSGKFREIYYQRLVMTAQHMINSPDEDEEGFE